MAGIHWKENEIQVYDKEIRIEMLQLKSQIFAPEQLK